MKTIETVLAVLVEYEKVSDPFDADVLLEFIQKYPEHARALLHYAYIALISVPATQDEIDAA